MKVMPTGLLDAKGCPIFEGDLIWSGMRRGDNRGWTLECVIWARGSWMLADPKTGELMAMQPDPMLRIKVDRPRVGSSCKSEYPGLE